MGEPTPAHGDRGEQQGSEPDALDTEREAAMMRAVMRAQERHREGGIDPELADADGDSG
jgi:hypothetical protein